MINFLQLVVKINKIIFTKYSKTKNNFYLRKNNQFTKTTCYLIFLRNLKILDNKCRKTQDSKLFFLHLFVNSHFFSALLVIYYD